MTEPTQALPIRRADLVIRSMEGQGRCVVKDSRASSYFNLGEEEEFILTQLDGTHERAGLRAEFASRFGNALDDGDLEDFLKMVGDQGWLSDASIDDNPSGIERTAVAPRRGETVSGIFYWRKPFFNPDRFLTWLAPKMNVFWTPEFIIASLVGIVAAAILVWHNRSVLPAELARTANWHTAAAIWFMVVTVTMLHELAHGLTCKRYGGEVKEIGFLLVFLLPCLYCNVSDAWLFPERAKRIHVTLAGAYFELVIWSISVLVWRITLPGTMVSWLAFVVMTTCGVQTLFNFNPLLKLDGYYLLSDWWNVPNLMADSQSYIREHARWLLWGAARPTHLPRGRALLTYGAIAFLYQFAFLSVMLFSVTKLQIARLGIGGALLSAGLCWLSVTGWLRGLSSGELTAMLRTRPRRTMIWGFLITATVAAMTLIRSPDRTSGPFAIRSSNKSELRSPVAGFLSEILVHEGSDVARGDTLVRLEVVDLESRLVQKQAEVRELQAKLRLLRQGTRKEEVREQVQRVGRAREWRGSRAPILPVPRLRMKKSSRVSTVWRRNMWRNTRTLRRVSIAVAGLRRAQ